eukprot:TRINITY_DN1896_c0_g1_i2.p1 TRINITY_DN1896_c0_g1~~TRINITY_DN1896_c0_g1_i2.p1  ORF type:complete len:783 (+),score=133.41 TRINITY_DN1896_c0_g1_i2:50-2398(+)
MRPQSPALPIPTTSKDRILRALLNSEGELRHSSGHASGSQERVHVAKQEDDAAQDLQETVSNLRAIPSAWGRDEELRSVDGRSVAWTSEMFYRTPSGASLAETTPRSDQSCDLSSLPLLDCSERSAVIHAQSDTLSVQSSLYLLGDTPDERSQPTDEHADMSTSVLQGIRGQVGQQLSDAAPKAATGSVRELVHKYMAAMKDSTTEADKGRKPEKIKSPPRKRPSDNTSGVPASGDLTQEEVALIQGTLNMFARSSRRSSRSEEERAREAKPGRKDGSTYERIEYYFPVGSTARASSDAATSTEAGSPNEESTLTDEKDEEPDENLWDSVWNYLWPLEGVKKEDNKVQLQVDPAEAAKPKPEVTNVVDAGAPPLAGSRPRLGKQVEDQEQLDCFSRKGDGKNLWWPWAAAWPASGSNETCPALPREGEPARKEAQVLHPVGESPKAGVSPPSRTNMSLQVLHPVGESPKAGVSPPSRTNMSLQVLHQRLQEKLQDEGTLTSGEYSTSEEKASSQAVRTPAERPLAATSAARQVESPDMAPEAQKLQVESPEKVQEARRLQVESPEKVQEARRLQVKGFDASVAQNDRAGGGFLVENKRDGNTHVVLRETSSGKVVARLPNGSEVSLLGPKEGASVQVQVNTQGGSCVGWIKECNVKAIQPVGNALPRPGGQVMAHVPSRAQMAPPVTRRTSRSQIPVDVEVVRRVQVGPPHGLQEPFGPRPQLTSPGSIQRPMRSRTNLSPEQLSRQESPQTVDSSTSAPVSPRRRGVGVMQLNRRYTPNGL